MRRERLADGERTDTVHSTGISDSSHEACQIVDEVLSVLFHCPVKITILLFC
jgi:hypothetical protein